MFLFKINLFCLLLFWFSSDAKIAAKEILYEMKRKKIEKHCRPSFARNYLIKKNASNK
jgi:hypothetical protein